MLLWRTDSRVSVGCGSRTDREGTFWSIAQLECELQEDAGVDAFAQMQKVMSIGDPGQVHPCSLSLHFFLFPF